MTGMTALGSSVTAIARDTFVVTFDEPITQQLAEMVKRQWREKVGGDLIIIAGGRPKLARLSDVEPTPIYDALVAKHGDPLGGAA